MPLKYKYLSVSGALKYYIFNKLILLFDNKFISVNRLVVVNFVFRIVLIVFMSVVWSVIFSFSEIFVLYVYRLFVICVYKFVSNKSSEFIFVL